MNLYYQDDLVSLFHGDCREILPTLGARLQGQVDLIVTDPPYGVDYVGRTKDKLKISNDALTPVQTQALVADAMRLSPLKPGGVFYVCSPGGDMELYFRLGLEDAGLQLRQAIVWVKDVFVMGHSDYHWRHETVLYGWRDGAAHYYAGARDQDTVWDVRRPKRSKGHPTTKPLGLVERAIWNSSRRGEIVLDPFAGGGSTLVAAKALGRRAIGIELEERYCAETARRCSQETLGLVIPRDDEWEAFG